MSVRGLFGGSSRLGLLQYVKSGDCADNYATRNQPDSGRLTGNPEVIGQTPVSGHGVGAQARIPQSHFTSSGSCPVLAILVATRRFTYGMNFLERDSRTLHKSAARQTRRYHESLSG
jgi:hypothetical protein